MVRPGAGEAASGSQSRIRRGGVVCRDDAGLEDRDHEDAADDPSGGERRGMLETGAVVPSSGRATASSGASGRRHRR